MENSKKEIPNAFREDDVWGVLGDPNTWKHICRVLPDEKYLVVSTFSGSREFWSICDFGKLVEADFLVKIQPESV